VARVSPFVTFCPTVTDTVCTGHVKVVDELDVPVDPPAPDVVAVVVTTSGVVPNLSPYTVLAATVPVATDVELTVPVVTVEVVYFELDAAPNDGPITTSNTAPMPTAISAIAASLAFI
jgi:hypothetical protein